jgi:hypothetical protein
LDDRAEPLSLTPLPLERKEKHVRIFTERFFRLTAVDQAAVVNTADRPHCLDVARARFAELLAQEHER